MKKILQWVFDNIFFVSTLFLLAFIPLYPKRPLLDIQHTWVYIRVEDFAVVFILLFWIVMLLFKKVTLKTPLTLPILLFWIIGAVSTLHGVLLFFPNLSDVFANVAFLSMLRRIEYLSLFFIAYSGLKDKKFIPHVVAALAVVLLLVILYGFGQKFFGFPAYLTMNEEFAKGIPIQLSQLSRVPSTFAGHYDLAAYLVLVIPLLVSMIFGFRNRLTKILLLIVASLGFVLMLMTVSRVSFFVLLLSLVMLLIIQKKRLAMVSLFIFALILLSFSPSLLERFGNTVSEIDVLVDAKTGAAIGQVKEVPSSYFENKTVFRQFTSDEEAKLASTSAIFPFSEIPSRATLVIEPNSPNGENLPQGTSYINLPLSPVSKTLKMYFYQKLDEQKGVESAKAYVFIGDFVVKRAKAYDLSFTTRFQGEWPRTLTAFERNIILGSGFGSVSLAVDNNYLRLLGEVGLLGFAAFISIFITFGIYIKKTLPKIDSPVIKSFVVGFSAGTFGLALNAIFIDVFEASKIAFTFWLLMGITLGAVKAYGSEEIDFYKEFKKVVTSVYAVIIYLFIATFALFSKAVSFYFVGDDFTWFRWIADCNYCQRVSTIIDYFTSANGFFYRPGTKMYFDFMYQAFWLNQTMYHLISLFLHFSVAVLIFLISKRILKDYFLSVACAVLFVILSGHHEAIFWISSTGFLFNAAFALLSLLFFIFWRERGRAIYFILSLSFIIFSLLFHELGVIVPLLVILYDRIFVGKLIKNPLTEKTYLLLLSPLLPYFLLRLLSGSHWFSGDYSYNLIKLPFNFIGNVASYFTLSLFGPSILPVYEKLRIFSREYAVLTILGLIIALFLFVQLWRLLVKKMAMEEKKIIIFALLFFIISLLPFLGLGNITSRYSYLASFAFTLLFVFFLKKAYGFLLSNGKYIAVSCMLLITIVFIATHLFQLQRVQTDWDEAGEKSQNFLTSLDYVYAHYPKEETQRLYFVNVPILSGDAWVFPVGLDDAVWLVLRNNRPKLYQAKDAASAFKELGGSMGKVLQFGDRGRLIELRITKSGIIYSVQK